MEQDRAVLFVDGNNWYHALKEVGATDLFQLDYAKVSKKIITPARAWALPRPPASYRSPNHNAPRSLGAAHC